MATNNFTLSQLDSLTPGYQFDGTELLLNTVVSAGAFKSVKTQTAQLSSYFVTNSTFQQSILKSGNIVAYGTYYINGDTRERIWSMASGDANLVRGTLQADAQGTSYDKYLHSGNIFVDTVNNHIYFPRGVWPRRQGQSSDDKDGWTWRELGGEGEAICRVNLDGTGFTIIKDLSPLNTGGTNLYTEPSCIAYDDVHDYIFFACRNDHDKSRVYRMDKDGANLVTWVEMQSNNVNIDCMDIAHIPQDFFAPNNPSCTSTYLYFGISPDYNKTGNIAQGAHAAVLRVPVIGTAPGILPDDYTGKYCVHRHWHSSYKDDAEASASTPNMASTGIKGIKVFISNNKTSDTAMPSWFGDNSTQHAVGAGSQQRPGNYSKQWTPAMSHLEVNKSNSRIFITHSGSRNVKRDQAPITNYGSGATPPAIPPMPDVPSVHEIEAVHGGYGYGGNSVMELLIGEPPGNPSSFTLQDDANRPYKTWREGDIYISGSSKILYMGYDDPGHAYTPTLPSGGVGAGRGTSWKINDHVYIATSPTNNNVANGSAGYLDGKSGRGVRRISLVGADVGNPGHNHIADTDGSDGGIGETGKVMVIPVIASNLISNVTTGEFPDNAQQSELALHRQGFFGLQDITINPCTMEIFFADFFASSYYLTNFQYSKEGDPYVPKIPLVPPIDAEAGNPPSNPTRGNPPTNPKAGNNPIKGNPPKAADPPYNPYKPGNNPIAGNNPIPGVAGNNPIAGRPGNPPNPYVDGSAEVAAIPATAGVAYRTTTPDDSYYGTIYRAHPWCYGRGTNGDNLFHRFNHIGYNRPCGVGGYTVGPWNDFRLIYTNGETQLLDPSSLVTDYYTVNLAARGREVNGLSQVFTKHNCLAGGKNIFTVSDFGYGNTNGLLITFENAVASSDYTVLTQAANGDTLTVPTLHLQDHPAYNLVQNQQSSWAKTRANTTQYLVDDPSLYQAKNTRQFRICYSDKVTDLDTLNQSYVVSPKSVNTVFFAVIH